MNQHSHQNAPTQFVDPQDLFTGYWREVLGQLLARLPGVGCYVQRHFSQNHRTNLWPLPDGHRMDVVLDGAVDVGFGDTESQSRYVKPSPVLFEDLAHLFERAVAYSLPNGSCTLVDREPNDLRNRLDRLHRLHLHLNGESGDGFRSWLSELARHLASMPGGAEVAPASAGTVRQRAPCAALTPRRSSGQ
jgi:hypothetical protein